MAHYQGGMMPNPPNNTPFPAASGGGSGVVTAPVVATYATSGDIATGGGTVDFEADTLPAQGVIDLAVMSRTLGDSNNLAAALYDGDPGDGGVFLANLVGTMFFGFDFTSGERAGPLVSAGGSNIQCSVPYKATAPWVRIRNADFSNTGRASLTLYVREVAEEA